MCVFFSVRQVHYRTSIDSGSERVKSFRSEPIRKTSFAIPSIPLTEEELARHNRVIPPLDTFPFSQQQLLQSQDVTEQDRNEEDEAYDYDDLNESLLLKRVDERCNIMKQVMDEKIKVCL
jgi:hypothetical protein